MKKSFDYKKFSSFILPDLLCGGFKENKNPTFKNFKALLLEAQNSIQKDANDAPPKVLSVLNFYKKQIRPLGISLVLKSETLKKMPAHLLDSCSNRETEFLKTLEVLKIDFAFIANRSISKNVAEWVSNPVKHEPFIREFLKAATPPYWGSGLSKKRTAVSIEEATTYFALIRHAIFHEGLFGGSAAECAKKIKDAEFKRFPKRTVRTIRDCYKRMLVRYLKIADEGTLTNAVKLSVS